MLLFENSPIHTSALTMRLLNYLRVPTVFSAPASFKCLPGEPVFGVLKKKTYDIDQIDEDVAAKKRDKKRKIKKTQRFST